jgi:hypothetical protein
MDRGGCPSLEKAIYICIKMNSPEEMYSKYSCAGVPKTFQGYNLPPSFTLGGF